MKVTIIENSRNADMRDNFWSSTGDCFFRRDCRDCPLYLYRSETYCFILRERFIAAVAPTTFPQTFDTDDYPELLI